MSNKLAFISLEDCSEWKILSNFLCSSSTLYLRWFKVIGKTINNILWCRRDSFIEMSCFPVVSSALQFRRTLLQPVWTSKLRPHRKICLKVVSSIIPYSDASYHNWSWWWTRPWRCFGIQHCNGKEAKSNDLSVLFSYILRKTSWKTKIMPIGLPHLVTSQLQATTFVTLRINTLPVHCIYLYTANHIDVNQTRNWMWNFPFCPSFFVFLLIFSQNF